MSDRPSRDQPKAGAASTGRDGRPSRSVAEWASFALAATLVLAVIGVLATGMVGDARPAAPVVHLDGPAARRGPGCEVRVWVRNAGDLTAANVQVVATLKVDGRVLEGEQTVDFLPGGGEQRLFFAFPADPDDGKLEVDVRSFAEP